MAKPKSLPYEAAETAGPWSVSLRFTAGGSDKVYQLSIVPAGDLFVVNFANGRYGGTMATGTKTSSPVDYAAARKAANSALFEKVGKGYVPTAGSLFGDEMGAEAIETIARKASGHVPQLLNPIEMEDVERFLVSSDWVAEVKHDGERRMLVVADGEIFGANRRGETVALSAAIKADATAFDDIVLDGEQMGDTFHYWDVLSHGQTDLKGKSLGDRLAYLDGLDLSDSATIRRTVTARTEAEKRELLAQTLGSGGEGLVFKKLDGRYAPGRPNSGGDWLKLKFWNTLSAVVSNVNAKRSVSMNLLDADDNVVPIGNVTIPANHQTPSKGDVIDVRYLYSIPGGSLIQPTFERKRNDIDPESCRTTQIVYKDQAKIPVVELDEGNEESLSLAR